MFFSRQTAEGQQQQVCVPITEERLDVVDQCKYLGVKFDLNLSLRTMLKTKCHKT